MVETADWVGSGVPVTVLGGMTGVELITRRVDETMDEVEDLGVEVGVQVELGVTVEVGVAVEVGVTVEVGVGVGVGVGVLVERGPVTVTGIQLRSLGPKVDWTSIVPWCAEQEAQVWPATLQETEAVLKNGH